MRDPQTPAGEEGDVRRDLLDKRRARATKQDTRREARAIRSSFPFTERFCPRLISSPPSPMSPYLYRPGTITVTRAAERRESVAIARALFGTEPDKITLTILSHHYHTHIHIHGNT